MQSVRLKKENILTIPNLLSLIRILLIPVIIWLYCVEEAYLPTILVIALSGFTDIIDGKIARKRNLITTFGKFADPIADKLLVNSIFIVLASKGAIPVIPVVIMLSRDTIVDCCRMLASQNGVVVAAGMMGKVKTVLQMVTISLVLINNLPFELFYFPMTTIMIWLTAFVSFASGYSYFVQMKSYIFESM